MMTFMVIMMMIYYYLVYLLLLKSEWICLVGVRKQLICNDFWHFLELKDILADAQI